MGKLTLKQLLLLKLVDIHSVPRYDSYVVSVFVGF
jgi:hypothetical protein